MFATVKLNTPVADTPAFRSRLAASGPNEPRAKHASYTVEEQKICPVTTLKLGAMGDPVSTDVEGGKVWTCCDACVAECEKHQSEFCRRCAEACRRSAAECREIEV